MTRFTLGLLLIAGPVVLSSCAAAAIGAAGAGAMTVNQERSVGEAIDDAAVSNEIKSKLIAVGGMGEVDVEVAGGLVLLSGRVATPELRVWAESIAWSVRRANDVANEIQIERAGGFFANASDEVISARVRSRLIGSSSVRASNINVETYGGVVYLLGIARDEEELRAAAEEASKAGGVSQVVSYIRLRNEKGQIVPYEPTEPAPNNPNELAGGLQ